MRPFRNSSLLRCLSLTLLAGLLAGLLPLSRSQASPVLEARSQHLKDQSIRAFSPELEAAFEFARARGSLSRFSENLLTAYHGSGSDVPLWHFFSEDALDRTALLSLLGSPIESFGPPPALPESLLRSHAASGPQGLLPLPRFKKPFRTTTADVRVAQVLKHHLFPTWPDCLPVGYLIAPLAAQPLGP